MAEEKASVSWPMCTWQTCSHPKPCFFIFDNGKQGVGLFCENPRICKACAQRWLTDKWFHFCRGPKPVVDYNNFPFQMAAIFAGEGQRRYQKYMLSTRETLQFHLTLIFDIFDVMDGLQLDGAAKNVRCALGFATQEFIEYLIVNRKRFELFIEMDNGRIFRRISRSTMDFGYDLATLSVTDSIEQKMRKFEHIDNAVDDYEIARGMMCSEMLPVFCVDKAYYIRKCRQKLKEKTGGIRKNWQWIQNILTDRKILSAHSAFTVEAKSLIDEVKSRWWIKEICDNRECKKKRADGVTLRICKGCKFMTYCSRRCQKIDWKRYNHRSICNQSFCHTLS